MVWEISKKGNRKKATSIRAKIVNDRDQKQWSKSVVKNCRNEIMMKIILILEFSIISTVIIWF